MFDSYLSRFSSHKIGHEPRVLLKLLSACALLSLLSAFGYTSQFAKTLGKGKSWKTISQYGKDVLVLRSIT